MSLTGIACAFASARFFGVSTPTAKGLLGIVDPWVLAAWFYPGAGLGLVAVQLARRLAGLPAHDRTLRGGSIPTLAGVIVIGGMVGPVLAMPGLARADAASASLLLNLEIVATLALAGTPGRESVDRCPVLRACSLLAGAIVLGGDAALVMRWGAVLIGLACLGRRPPADPVAVVP